MWPDNLVVFDRMNLVLRGIINLDGSRDQFHTELLREYILLH